ncbi:TPA: hypothetical protein NID01_000548 [Pseudomonas aeruginosa]|nr:hypothetical protein [Pseudomonas aeruginosa]HEO1552378.1 hypothetical protein [Pseudomonas aeruginosa]
MSTLWPSLLYEAQGPHAPKAYDQALPAYLGVEEISSQLQPGPLAGSGAVPEIPRQIAGSRWRGVNDTFYNRLLVEPSLLELGNLLSNQTRTISVWNGFLENKTISAFQRVNDAGISVTEPVAVPYVLRPLEQLTYILNVSTDGPAVIDAQYVWTVDGTDYSAEVTGRRVVVFPFGPNWNTPVTEPLEWLTNVLRSYAGNEQRRSLRVEARRELNYSLRLTRQQSARLENLLWGWQNRIYAMPIWTDKPHLTARAQRGDLELLLPTDTYSFSAGALAVLYQNAETMEVVEIDTVAAGRLALRRPLESDWGVDTAVMPMVLGHLPTSVPLMRYTNNTLTGSISFACDPNTTDPYTPAGTPPVQYEGLEVITRQPNWVSPLDNSFAYEFQTLDQQAGAVLWNPTEEFPRIIRRYTWLLNGRQQIKAFRQALGRWRGQARALYVPSWHEDFKVTRVIGASDVGIAVEENEFRSMVGVDPARNRLMLRLENGQMFFRKIVGVSTDGTYTLLTIDAPFNQQIEVNQVRALHLLMRCRLATDRVELVWRTSQVATVDTTFTTILE